jgi:hypothetical protein
MDPSTMLFFLLLSIPFWICALVVWRGRGGSWRIAAITTLIIMTPALAMDINSVIQGGTLTGLATLFASAVSVLVLLVLAANRSQKPQSVLAKHVLAVLSSIFLFAGAFFLWLSPLLFPLGIQFGTIGIVLYWLVGGAVALAVAVYSFRAAVKRQATKGPVESSAEVVESSGEIDWRKR